MIDATLFATGLRALVFSQCHHEDRDLLADVEVAALNSSTLEVSGDDTLGVLKFAGLTLSILHIRNASRSVQYITQVTPLERGASVVIRWEIVSETDITSTAELPRAGVRKCAVPSSLRATSSSPRGAGR